MKDLYLVRHGQATGGPSKMDRDHRLTELGVQQASNCGRKLKEIGVVADKIYASPMTRAKMTAELISRHVPAPIVLRDDMIEHGCWPYMLDCSIEEAARLHPEAVRADGKLKVNPGDREEGLTWTFAIAGESMRMLHDRAKRVWDSVQAAHPGDSGTYILVAHGSFLSAMVTEALGLPLQPAWRFGFQNAGFLHMCFYRDCVTGAMLPELAIHGPNGEYPCPPKPSESLDRK